MRSRFFLFCMALPMYLFSSPFPIQFSIPESKIVNDIPNKVNDFAFIIPGNLKTYIYDEESDYYMDYQKAYYAVTMMKAGWDCLRHYEILANGCIPYFLNLEQCPANTMTFLPKDLILEAMQLEGVSYLQIDHSKFDVVKYYDLLNRILQHTRQHLTTKSMAEYVLSTAGYEGSGKILFLTEDPTPDYLRCLTLIGLKELLGDRVIDVPKIEHIYKTYPGNVKALYGKGFSYSKIVEDLPVNRDNLERRIRAREFDLIIYGSLHRGLRHYKLVSRYYAPNQIIYLCGEDLHNCTTGLHNLFIREY